MLSSILGTGYPLYVKRLRSVRPRVFFNWFRSEHVASEFVWTSLFISQPVIEEIKPAWHAQNWHCKSRWNPWVLANGEADKWRIRKNLDSIISVHYWKLPDANSNNLLFCKFGLCSLCGRPIVALRYLKVVSPLEILDGLYSLRVRNDLMRMPLLSSL